MRTGQDEKTEAGKSVSCTSSYLRKMMIVGTQKLVLVMSIFGTAQMLNTTQAQPEDSTSGWLL